MFDIGWGELLLIGIVALIAIGPKELPGALRTLGQWMAKVRRMAAEFQNQFHDAIREAELSDLKKEVDEMAAKASSYTHFDPLDQLQKEIDSAAGPLPSLDMPVTDTTATSADAQAPVSGPTAAAPVTPVAEAQPPVADAPPAPDTPAISVADAAPPAEPGAPVPAKPDAGRAA